MKRLLALALLSFCGLANAANYGIGLAYDYAGANSANAVGLDSVVKEGIIIGTRNVFGTFDANFFNTKVRGIGARGTPYADDVPGIELGYGNTITKLGPVSLNGRVAVGRLFNRGLGNPESTAVYSTAQLSAAMPLTAQVGASLALRHRFDGRVDAQNVYSIGLSYAPIKTVSIQLGYNHFRGSNRILNGGALTAFYFF